MQKKYTQAPLPFIGQKRQFLNHFEKIINDNIHNQGKGWTVIDVFGGSGLLAHTVKRLKPEAHVIYNDFDNYSERLANIKDTNKLRTKIYEVVKGQQKTTIIDEDKKQKIIDIIDNFKGYKDVNCLNAWLLFPGAVINSLEALKKKRFYHRINKSNYTEADDYLAGIEIISESFKTLLPRFTNKKNALLLLDPPYLCTEQIAYKNKNYFDLIDFLDLIDLTKPPYIFFSSTKSEFIRFLDWQVSNKKDNYKSFENAKKITVQRAKGCKGRYEDNMVYKFTR